MKSKVLSSRRISIFRIPSHVQSFVFLLKIQKCIKEFLKVFVIFEFLSQSNIWIPVKIQNDCWKYLESSRKVWKLLEVFIKIQDLNPPQLWKTFFLKFEYMLSVWGVFRFFGNCSYGTSQGGTAVEKLFQEKSTGYRSQHFEVLEKLKPSSCKILENSEKIYKLPNSGRLWESLEFYGGFYQFLNFQEVFRSF